MDDTTKDTDSTQETTDNVLYLDQALTPEDVNDTLSRWVVQARKSKGWSQATLAKKMGRPQATIANWEVRSGKMAFFDVLHVSRVTNCGLPVQLPSQEEVKGEVVTLKNVDEMIGNAFVEPKQRTVASVQVNSNWLEEVYPAISKSKSPGLLTMPDQSMEKSFKQGDTLLADLSVNEFREDGIYAFEEGGRFYIRRVARKLGGGFLVLTDSDKFENQELPVTLLAGVQVRASIIGVWKWEKL